LEFPKLWLSAKETPNSKIMQESTSGNSNNSLDIVRQLATLAAIVGAFAVNVISNINPPGGVPIGEISNTVFKNVPIIPANYAFAIWGLIYLGLFAFAVYQALPPQRQQPDLRKIGYLLVIASIAQSVWVYLFLGRMFTYSVVAMFLILIPLIATYLILGIGRNPVGRIKKWCVHYPISIYLSWISVATIVNVACALYSQGWNRWGLTAEIWTAIMLFVASAVCDLVLTARRDIAYTGVTVWALVAVAVKQWNNQRLGMIALGCAVLLIIMTFVIQGVRRDYYD
jgi:hypothetical protein